MSAEAYAAIQKRERDAWLAGIRYRRAIKLITNYAKNIAPERRLQRLLAANNPTAVNPPPKAAMAPAAETPQTAPETPQAAAETPQAAAPPAEVQIAPASSEGQIDSPADEEDTAALTLALVQASEEEMAGMRMQAIVRLAGSKRGY